MSNLTLQTEKTRTRAWFLALAGFVPFVLLAGTLFLLGVGHEAYASVFDVFKIYSVIILSFLGGIRWGLAISYQPGEPRNLLLSVVPPIFGWFAILLPDPYAILILIIAFCGQGAWDNFYANEGKVQPWFGSLRVVLTFLVVAVHVVVLFSLT